MALSPSRGPTHYYNMVKHCLPSTTAQPVEEAVLASHLYGCREAQLCVTGGILLLEVCVMWQHASSSPVLCVFLLTKEVVQPLLRCVKELHTSC